MTVERVRVGEVLRLERRSVTVEPDRTYEEIGVRSFGRGIFHKEPVSGTDLRNKRVFRIEPDDLVISNVFAWEGAIAVASNAEAGKVGSHRFMTFVPADDGVDTAWAAWFFRSEPGLELIGKASPGSAGRNRTLAIDRFEALEIPLPSIGEQRRAAARLDRIEAAAAELLRRSERGAVLNDALAVSIALRPDLDDAAKTRAGWRRLPLGNVMTASTSQVPVEPVRQYLIAGIYSFGRGLIDRGSIDGAETSYATLTKLTEGDITVSKLNGWEGAVSVVDQPFDGYHVSSEYPTFKPDRSHLLPDFFAGIARAPSFWEDLNTSARGSMVRRRRINAAEFLATEVWLPPIEVQKHAARAFAMATDAGRERLRTRERVNALAPAAMNEAFRSLS